MRTLSLLVAVVVLGACTSDVTTEVAQTSTSSTTSTTTTTTIERPTTTKATTTTSTTTTTTTATTLPVPAPPTPPAVVLEPGPPAPEWPPHVPLPGVSGVAALTNLAAGPEFENVPSVAVKIDNHPKARPQWALSWADVVIEENVESLTRFIAVFHSRLPGEVGPIRSARSGDLPILAALNRPILVWSGGNPNVTAAVRSAANAGVVVNISAFTNGRCFWRATGRRAPHNLMANPQCALDASPTAGPARPAWTFDDTYQPQGPVTEQFEVRMDGVTATWVWDPTTSTYLRSQNGQAHVGADAVQVGATNVVIMSVVYLPSPADARSPEAQTVGQGPVTVHRGGVAVSGTWSRNVATEPFLFTDGAGAVIALASGTTFIQLPRL